ncbi:hypothetical protein [Fusobacterium sp.]|uniref:hypothetical protein n=1 Tax=Fusobacterium sp. TaxID=68766 RepID=UPI0025C4D08A|nr:hypothetical protein [Fusobacterium sp.]MCI5724678.1 hypothetical protein [Fusobacterium sp.]MCI7223080.1 hypothetical protein [Fusobacterium sp.]MDD7410243.1 hypothetical protein [Fusobacteriaceae bacterium]MDY5712543.1 hypothetical protein [Fusobacterium gastrosuis]
MNADLHTDLANKEEREKITLAGRKVKTGAEAITNPNEGGINNTFKEGLFAVDKAKSADAKG